MKLPKVSIVDYLNALPLSWGFLRGPQRELFEIDLSPPSRCADLLAQGVVDSGLIPVIEYQTIPSLRVVPGLGVSARSRVRSVLLVSKVPVPQIQALAADNSSRTSVCLVQLLLRVRYNRSPIVRSCPPDLKRMLDGHDAALIIGDVALKAKTVGLYVYDLASEWQQLTGKPFVFAFWAVRAGSCLTDPTPFHSSFQFGMDSLSLIVEEQSQKLGLSAAEIRTYLTENIQYRLERDNLEGLKLFYQLAREWGLTDQERPLEFLSE
ncbi:MAG: menaquinone biosynthesis protein [Acidobacteriota bacterium]